MVFYNNSGDLFDQVIDSNGQRICFPKNVTTTTRLPPRKGSEIFVGNIPHDIYEKELFSIFVAAGPIFKLRLMMDFNGTNRGFAFITYFTLSDTYNAIYSFDGHPIRKHSCLTVKLSVDNRRLYLGNIPRRKTAQEIQGRLEQILVGVVQVFVYDDIGNPGMNRGFAFVEFATHAQAAIAKKLLVTSNPSLLWRNYRKIVVDWAYPEPVVHPVEFLQLKILHFKNLPYNYGLRQFKDVIYAMVGMENIERIYKKDNYAFVHFTNRRSAEATLEKMMHSEKLVIWDRVIEAEWARPGTYRRRVREEEPPNNLCVSVPLRLRRMVIKTKNEIFRRKGSSTVTESSGHSAEENLNEDFLSNSFSQMMIF